MGKMTKRIVTLMLATAAAILQIEPAIAEDIEIITGRPPFDLVIGETHTRDINERSEFSVAEQVANQYLVVKLEITKTSITPLEASLTRGPDKANDAIKDLQVRSLDSTRLVAQYSVADPRFQRIEPSASPRDLGSSNRATEAPMKELIIFVPLSSMVDKVEVVPEPDRAGTVSSGGDFDPLPWATVACTGHDPDLFPNCPAILALGIPPP